jgi:hypothetical protein
MALLALEIVSGILAGAGGARRQQRNDGLLDREARRGSRCRSRDEASSDADMVSPSKRTRQRGDLRQDDEETRGDGRDREVFAAAFPTTDPGCLSTVTVTVTVTPSS